MSGRSRLHADLALAGVTLIWGTTFVTVKNVLDHVTPILFLALRFSVAAAALALLLRKHLRNRSGLLPGAGAGVLLFAGYVLQTIGLSFTSAAKSAFITGLTVPAVPLLAALVYRSKPRPAELAGVASATGGLALMTLPAGSLRVNPGDALTLLCALAFAGHILMVGHFSVRASFESMSVWQVTTAALLAASTFWWVEKPTIQWTFGIYIAVALTGLLATALAFTVQAWAQQYTTATRVAIIFALEPVFAWITSYMFAGETLSVRGGTGGALILAGILLATLKPSQLQAHPSK